MTLLIYAPSIHCGGGLSLLTALLSVVPDGSIVIVDERLPVKEQALKRFSCYRIQPRFWHRLQAERLLKVLSKKQDKVLCFGNLPPMFPLKSNVSVFIQNRHLVEKKLMEKMPLKLHLRLTMERIWLRFFHKNADHIIVQTQTMKSLAEGIVTQPVSIAPFMTLFNNKKIQQKKVAKSYEFIYVASGEPHKNHHQLIQAWVELAKQNKFPSLCLTVQNSAFPEVSAEIQRAVQNYGVKIKNVGYSDDIQGLLLESQSLIFPSILESFGLPLLEAQQAGLPIIASELDYVRDVVELAESFDPYSAMSIARAVCRFMGDKNEKAKILNAQGFLDKVFDVDREEKSI